MPDVHTFPDEALRGLYSDGLINPDGESVNHSVFYFKNDGNGPCRPDQCNEVSINWHDAPEAMQIVRVQKKKDSEELQFKGGVAVLSRNQIDSVRIQARVIGKLSYERKIDPENPGNTYHGNLLLKNDVCPNLMKSIAASISLCVIRIVKN